jgi:1-acyl-sn-glycerol-3-phosphate acyltransferase
VADLVACARAVDDWLSRAGALVPLRDRAVLLSPPILVHRFLRYACTGHKRDFPSHDPRARDPEFVRLMLDLFRVLGRHYFRLEVQGTENVPATGPVLLVGNHNAGLLPADGFFTALAIWDRFGPSRAVYALAHDFLFHDPTLRRYATRLGMLRAGHDGARRALSGGDIVLVYPGGDLDAFRSWRQRGRVVLGGRKGFLRLAIGAGVPIVPVVSAGTHEQLVIVTRGDGLARFLHMHRWARTTVCPIVVSVPWGVTSGFVPYLPLPAQTTIAFGAPISWPALSSRDATDPAILDRCYAEVEGRMQSMLDGLMADRRPLVGARARRAGRAVRSPQPRDSEPGIRVGRGPSPPDPGDSRPVAWRTKSKSCP